MRYASSIRWRRRRGVRKALAERDAARHTSQAQQQADIFRGCRSSANCQHPCAWTDPAARQHYKLCPQHGAAGSTAGTHAGALLAGASRDIASEARQAGGIIKRSQHQEARGDPPGLCAG